MPWLLIDSPSLATPVRTYFADRLVIGRASQVDLQILDNRISKRHARIVRNDGGFLQLEDLDSRNGTFFQEKRLNSAVQLKDGDQFRLGDTELTLDMNSEEVPGLGPNKRQLLTMRRQTVSTEFPRALFSDDENPQLMQDYNRLRLAWRLSNEIGLERPFSDQAEKILQILRKEFDADRAVLLLFAPNHTGPMTASFLVPVVACNSAGPTNPQKVHVPDAILSAALRGPSGIVTSDARSDERFSSSQSVVIQGIKSTLTVPLIARSGKLIGVLSMDSTQALATFHSKDLLILDTVGHQIATAVENVRLLEQSKQQLRVRQRLSRFLSPNLVEEVISGRVEISDEPDLRDVTIMFADLREFTRMIQNIPADQVVLTLREFYERCMNIIFEHNGTLDKFTGDGIMALFGAPISLDKPQQCALDAARKIQHEIKALNLERTALGRSPLGLGIGIASGPVVVGALGTEEIHTYSVIGPAANLAARLCSKASAGEILISETISEAIGGPEMDSKERMVGLKGYDKPVRAYSVPMD